MNKRIGVLLSGCGVYDGSEIHESILTLLHIEKLGCTYRCFSLDHDQMHVVNHKNNDVTGEKRNMIFESARIARGKIECIREADVRDIDALILPGGLGAAKNLCDFALRGANCTVNRDVHDFVMRVYNAKKPIGAICIAPAVIAKIFSGVKKLTLTIGTDRDTASKIMSMGHVHVNHSVDEVEVDRENKIVTTPAYMLAKSILEVERGIERLVREVIEL